MAGQYATRQATQNGTHANMFKTCKKLQKTPKPETGTK